MQSNAYNFIKYTHMKKSPMETLPWYMDIIWINLGVTEILLQNINHQGIVAADDDLPSSDRYYI